MEFQKIELKDGSTYSVAIDDHCLVVCVGKSGSSKSKIWLSQEMVEWITKNGKHIDFGKDEWTAGIGSPK